MPFANYDWSVIHNSSRRCICQKSSSACRKIRHFPCSALVPHSRKELLQQRHKEPSRKERKIPLKCTNWNLIRAQLLKLWEHLTRKSFPCNVTFEKAWKILRTRNGNGQIRYRAPLLFITAFSTGEQNFIFLCARDFLLWRFYCGPSIERRKTLINSIVEKFFSGFSSVHWMSELSRVTNVDKVK